MADDRPIVLFDALCLLCSANAQFILTHDRSHQLMLASVQSEAGIALCRRFGVDPDDPETLLFVRGGQALHDSDAIIAIWRALGWPWQALTVAAFVPRMVRDPLYRWVARNRYRLFGRRTTCWLPDPAWRDRLL